MARRWRRWPPLTTCGRSYLTCRRHPLCVFLAMGRWVVSIAGYCHSVGATSGHRLVTNISAHPVIGVTGWTPPPAILAGQRPGRHSSTSAIIARLGVRVLPPPELLRLRPVCDLPPSSSGLGHHPLKVETRVRTPLGVPAIFPSQSPQLGVSSPCAGGLAIPSATPLLLRRTLGCNGRTRAAAAIRNPPTTQTPVRRT
jgi:hypothetical protein